jgi:hypothetical protein
MIKQALALVGLSVLTLSANAALYDRGNGLIYDDVMDITWLQDANYAQTSGYAAANAVGGPHTGSTNIQADGAMGWDAANTWAAQLEYGGYDDWRLASANLMNGANPCYATDGSCDRGYNNTTGELGHMFYNNLGNLGYYDASGSAQSGYGVTNSSFTDGDSGDSVSILNLQNSVYWLGEEYAPDANRAWAFLTNYGYQSPNYKSGSFYSWAVRAGDVSSVPVPAAAWLFGTALLGLVGVKRRHR